MSRRSECSYMVPTPALVPRGSGGLAFPQPVYAGSPAGNTEVGTCSGTSSPCMNEAHSHAPEQRSTLWQRCKTRGSTGGSAGDKGDKHSQYTDLYAGEHT